MSPHPHLGTPRSISLCSLHGKVGASGLRSIVLRFARLELVRSEWRKYENSLLAPGEYGDPGESLTSFNVAAVNIEENGSRSREDASASRRAASTACT